MKKILVTGAAGFIGFHLSKALIKRGDEVLGFDSFNDYYTPQLKRDRQLELSKAGVEIVEGDLCDEAFLKNTCQDFQPTHVAHLAAQAGVRYSLENPKAYIHSNLEAFVNLLEFCKQHQTPLIYASSSSVYGDNKKVPFSTDDVCDNQASLYGVTKKTNELMANTYHKLYGIPVTGLRFFTVYGPWGRPDMAYFSFTKAIMEEQPIRVFNHGKLQRDFTYIDDIIQGTIAAIDKSYENEIFNLGNHQPVKLETFIQTIETALGKEAVKEYVPMQPGDVMTTYADISSSQKKLGFYPSTSLEDGIPKFVEWFQEYHPFTTSKSTS